MLAATVRLPEIAGLGPIEIVSDIDRYLVEPNERYLKAYGSSVPWLIDANVEYQKERDEEWLTIPYVIEAKAGDCEDLSSWLVAEDRIKLGYDSQVGLYESQPGLQHCIALRPLDCPLGRWARWCIKITASFYVLDPSRAKGMRRGSPTRTYTLFHPDRHRTFLERGQT